MSRKAIPKRLRFEVFKRDSFKCQYCGQNAPNVVLVIDHIHPVSLGGKNDILNLITSCDGCNSGKSDKTISDQTAVSHQKAQIDRLQERREQLKMMVDWRNGLNSLRQEEIDAVAEYWNKATGGYSLNQSGIAGIASLFKKYHIGEILTAVDAARDTYIESDNDGHSTFQSVETAFSKLGGICAINKLEKADPGIRELFYIRGIIRKKCDGYKYVDWQALNLLKEARQRGASIEGLKAFALEFEGGTLGRFEGNLRYALDEMERSRNA